MKNYKQLSQAQSYQIELLHKQDKTAVYSSTTTMGVGLQVLSIQLFLFWIGRFFIASDHRSCQIFTVDIAFYGDTQYMESYQH